MTLYINGEYSISTKQKFGGYLTRIVFTPVGGFGVREIRPGWWRPIRAWSGHCANRRIRRWQRSYLLD